MAKKIDATVSDSEVVETVLDPELIDPVGQEDKADFVVPSFSKGSILKQKKYKEHEDLLRALLQEDKQYTHAEVDSILAEFKGRKVK